MKKEKTRKKRGAKRFGEVLKAWLWSAHRFGNRLRFQQAAHRKRTCKCPAQFLMVHTSPWRRAAADYVAFLHGVRTALHNLTKGPLRTALDMGVPWEDECG